MKWVFILFPFFVAAQDYHCVEYNLRVDEKEVFITEVVCYVSELQKTRKKHIVTVTTGRYVSRFAVLRTYPISGNGSGQDRRGVYNGTLMLAIVVGEPDQLYAIREERKNSDYYFSIKPIEQNREMKTDISGRVLEVSNKYICDAAQKYN